MGSAASGRTPLDDIRAMDPLGRLIDLTPGMNQIGDAAGLADPRQLTWTAVVGSSELPEGVAPPCSGSTDC